MSKEPRKVMLVGDGSENVSDSDAVGILVGAVFVIATCWAFFHYNLFQTITGRIGVFPCIIFSWWIGFKFGYDILTAMFLSAVLYVLYVWIF